MTTGRTHQKLFPRIAGTLTNSITTLFICEWAWQHLFREDGECFFLISLPLSESTWRSGVAASFPWCVEQPSSEHAALHDNSSPVWYFCAVHEHQSRHSEEWLHYAIRARRGWALPKRYCLRWLLSHARNYHMMQAHTPLRYTCTLLRLYCSIIAHYVHRLIITLRALP